MERFLTRHKDRIIGIIAGYDRLLFRGQAKSLCYSKGMEIFLTKRGVRLKDFKAFALQATARVTAHAKQLATSSGRPFEYLASSAVSKEARARAIAERDGITEGLVCILSCVEPCTSYDIRRDSSSGHLHLVARQRRCAHLYFYYVDRAFGLMHVRLQTWLPFTVQVCVNGREWLARRLRRAGIAYRQHDNCLTWVADLPQAQRWADQLTTRAWAPLLTLWARRVNPWLDPAADFDFHGYQWCLRESEYATDVLFRDPASLAAIYPALVRHAIERFESGDVLRFLGRRVPRTSTVTSSLRRRPEGVRVKHWVNENSIKMYDKAGSVLRIEITINKPRRFKVRRRTRRGGQSRLAWLAMRQGVADIPRRVEVSRAANARYLDALSVVGDPTPSHRVLDPVSRPVIAAGRRYRPLRPISPDDALLFRAVLTGERLLDGFRNADLLRVLAPDIGVDPQQRRRASARVTRLIRLLRAHGVLHKVAHTQYYRVSPAGHTITSTALAFRDTEIALLAA